MYKYTLCFIIKDNQVLMLNRNKLPWMGCWNGVGGKVEINETPLECIKREIYEETNINPNDLEILPKGIVTWNDNFEVLGGLYLFIAYYNNCFDTIYPLKTEEGILDVKNINWVISTDNYGCSHNIKYLLPNALKENGLYNYYCHFKNRDLITVEINKLNDEYYQNFNVKKI